MQEECERHKKYKLVEDVCAEKLHKLLQDKDEAIPMWPELKEDLEGIKTEHAKMIKLYEERHREQVLDYRPKLEEKKDE